MLYDSYGRVHNYLRISLTEACNMACSYCMPDNDFHTEGRYKMKTDELLKLAGIFVEQGITKIRITGGEPLVRKNAAEIIYAFSELKQAGLKTLAITTNGLLVNRFIETFKKSGIHSVNVSLDTLMPERFEKITKRNNLHTVLANIHQLLQEGFFVKVNMVVMQNVNDDEVTEFVQWTRDYPIHVRFIEFMPFDGNRWLQNKVVPFQNLLERVKYYFEVEKLDNARHDTAKAFKVPGFAGTFSFISTITEPFCSDCNRLRLTADGKLKNCLFSKTEADLLTALRNGDDVVQLIEQNVKAKAAERGGQFNNLNEDASGINNRSMIRIGG